MLIEMVCDDSEQDSHRVHHLVSCQVLSDLNPIDTNWLAFN